MSPGPMERTADRSAYEVTVVRSLAEADPLRPAWQALLEREESPCFDSDPDRYAAILESKAESRPYSLVVKSRGEVVAMILGRIETVRLPCSLGYKSIAMPSLQCLDIKHGWWFGQLTDDVAAVLLDEIQRALKSAEADVVHFHGLSKDSPLYRAVAARSRGLQGSHSGRVETHRTMRLPESLEAFYLGCSKKHRANLRRYVRRIEEQFGERAVITAYHDEGSVDTFGKVAEQVSATTYQHGLGCGMVYDERMQYLMRHLARQGLFRAHVLYLEGEPAAFQQGVIYRGQYFLEQIGFDPKWRDHNVGTVLFLHVLEELCHPDSGARVMDFGSGDAEYKSSYGDKEWEEASVFMFAPRFFPTMVNLLRTGITGLNVGLQRIVSKAGVTNWLKRRWRNRLQKPAPTEADAES